MPRRCELTLTALSTSKIKRHQEGIHFQGYYVHLHVVLEVLLRISPMTCSSHYYFAHKISKINPDPSLYPLERVGQVSPASEKDWFPIGATWSVDAGLSVESTIIGWEEYLVYMNPLERTVVVPYRPTALSWWPMANWTPSTSWDLTGTAIARLISTWFLFYWKKRFLICQSKRLIVSSRPGYRVCKSTLPSKLMNESRKHA